MEYQPPTIRQILLKFKTPEDLNNFRIECSFYMNNVGKDPNTLFGTFTEKQLYIAINTYSTIVSIESDYNVSRSTIQYAPKILYAMRK